MKEDVAKLRVEDLLPASIFLPRQATVTVTQESLLNAESASTPSSSGKAAAAAGKKKGKAAAAVESKRSASAGAGAGSGSGSSEIAAAAAIDGRSVLRVNPLAVLISSADFTLSSGAASEGISSGARVLPETKKAGKGGAAASKGKGKSKGAAKCDDSDCETEHKHVV